jgi:hypothetical protein
LPDRSDAILAVDPGLDGGWAVYWPHNGELVCGDLPTSGEKTKRQFEAALFRDIIKQYDGIMVAVVESVHAFKGQGVSSTFRFGEAYGGIKATIKTLDIPLVSVTPQKWKGHFGLKGSEKEPSRQHAVHAFPKFAHFFKRKLDHGRAEAALIALWYANRANMGAL